MYTTFSNTELAEFIRSEMLDEIAFRDNLGKESKVTYRDFFTGLCERKTLTPHLELVSCVTSIDEFYPVIYNCFVEDYGTIDFYVHPESYKKFSPLLFTKCLDFVNNKGVIITREYTEEGKDIAYLEKLLYSEIHFTRLESTVSESVYYKDFLLGMMKSGEEIDSSLGALMTEAQSILQSKSQKVEVSEEIILLFYAVFEGIVSPPNKINKALHASYFEDLQFMLSPVGVYTCVNHINKIGDLGILLPVVHTKKSNKRYRKKHIPVIVAVTVAVLTIIVLAKMYC